MSIPLDTAPIFAAFVGSVPRKCRRYYADAPEREAADDVEVGDIGLYALQVDDKSGWKLIGVAPVAWEAATDPVQGEQGIQGDQGEQGIQGEPGEPGEPGEQGIQGEQGEQGIQGEDGPMGPSGTVETTLGEGILAVTGFTQTLVGPFTTSSGKYPVEYVVPQSMGAGNAWGPGEGTDDNHVRWDRYAYTGVAARQFYLRFFNDNGTNRNIEWKVTEK